MINRKRSMLSAEAHHDSVLKSNEDDMDYQRFLAHNGYVVVPTPLLNRDLRKDAQDGFIDHILQSPEFANPDPKDPEWKPQLCSSMSLSNPSSFHHTYIRNMREKLTALILELDVLPIQGRNLEQTFEVLLHGATGKTKTEQQLHRDEAPTSLENDVLFGGWMNLDDDNRYFTCCPSTHLSVSAQNSGFVSSPKYEQARYRKRDWTIVDVPPGMCIIFYARLLHEVSSHVADHNTTSMSILVGWRVTDAKDPLFGKETTLQWIADQAVPKLKSGMEPQVWPNAYSHFPRVNQTDRTFTRIEYLTEWSKNTFVANCIETSNAVASGEAKGTTFTCIRSRMLSLREYGLQMHRPYDHEEVSLLFPQTVWHLYTFDSQSVRSEYQGVTKETWDSYQCALKQKTCPEMVIRRPRPECVSL